MRKPKRITKKDRDNMRRATLHLADELPRFGSGIRRVLVRKETPTFVWLLYGDVRARVRRDVFEAVRVKKL